MHSYRNRHCERLEALLHDSIKAAVCHSRAGGNPAKNTFKSS
ncbi:hypothetical protein [Rickettsia endosymbiont of Orchestes rusci]